MDKYTVDLDKVLNDFEYSELTEQSDAPQQQPYPAHSSKNDRTVKHSINNVFNSLNEYLNTEITERNSYLNAETTEDNYTPERNSYAYVNDEKTTATNSYTAESYTPETNSYTYVKDDKITVSNSYPPLDGEIIENKSYSPSYSENSQPVHMEIVETNSHTSIESEIIEQNTSENLNNEIVEVNSFTPLNVKEEVTYYTEKFDTEINYKEKPMQDISSVPDVKCSNGDEIQPNQEPSQSLEVVVEHREATNEEICDINSKTVGFDAVSDDDIDEDELNKYLSDLEMELDRAIEIEESVEATETVNNANTQKPNESTLNFNEDSVKVIKNDVTRVKNTNETINAVRMPEDVVTVADEAEEVVVDLNAKEAEELGTGIEDRMDVCETVNSPEDGGSGNSEADTYETCSEHMAEAGFRKCAMKDSMEDSVTSQSERPNSLDINGPADGKREINLIGNPGSTPYNNLYITKEISVEKTKLPGANNYESESSASISPTFSEASTDSVRSTDSTDDSEIEPVKDDGEDVSTPKVEVVSVPEEASGDSGGPENVAGGSGATPVVKMVENVDTDVYVDADNIGPTSVTSGETQPGERSENELWLGKRAPVWIPDADALNCLHCDMKFTVIKRRHHCRACGLVLCSKCCNLKHRLEYLDSEARVCTKCHEILTRDSNSSSGSEASPAVGNSPARPAGQPNPNNPMEYCSVVPPLQQVSNSGDTPPSVMVPVGVLKRKGSNKAKHNKSVMFCDGIRPGSDLTNLDNDFNYNETKSPSSSSSKKPLQSLPKANRNCPNIDPNTKSFIPENESCLPPTVTTFKSDSTYTECANNANVVEMLKNEMLTFALQCNLHIHVRLITMDCCINKQAWCFSTEGLINVGQDEIVVLLEYIDNEKIVPKDVFYHLNNIYNEAVKGNTVTELGLSMHPTTNFLDSKNHAGFIYIRPTFQCLQKLILPKEPYLVGILVHRWETPWAKIFPLRLVLRLGAEYRYYPSPVISSRHRDSVFVEIGHTIINLLADFRNFTYTLPNIRGLTIHMEGKNTTVTIPVNRYDQVMKSISNSSDHILAFGGNFSETTDSHLVCIQDTHGNNENNYTTHAINIQNKPRKVTGASFIVFNGALKSSSGLTAKSSIVEDGLMIQIPADQMVLVRESLRNMKNHTIQCGCVNAASDETVNVVWGDPDINFNLGVKSSVDGQTLSGVPSIRVHNGKDYVCNSGIRLIRWTEVFLVQNGEENARTQDPVDVSKVAESIAKATCQALVKYLDLLASNNFTKIGIRTTLHVENVSYSAGSNGIKLPPIYMNSLDNELIPVLHRITSNNLGDSAIVLELIFRILNV